jgi:hypothetical protein
MIFILVVFAASNVNAQYAIGDFGSTASGNWGSVGTWSTWNGSGWTAAIATPGPTNNVFILSTRTVVLNSTGPWYCNKLYVETGGKLWCGPAAVQNIYLYVMGDIYCSGIVGNGAIFDYISFGIEGATCTISGTGAFDASRMRKNTNTNATTNLTIAMNVNLRFAASSNTQIYNGAPGSTRFNVTVMSGFILHLTSNGGALVGNASMDGTGGVDLNTCGGTYTINGTMIVTGTVYLTTNNLTAGYGVGWYVNAGGLLKVGQVATAASGAAGHLLRVMPGGKFEITGSPGFIAALNTTNCAYDLQNGSYTEFSGTGTQNVPIIPAGSNPLGASSASYGYLLVTGSLTKTMFNSGIYNVANDLNISNVTGSPVLDCQNQAIYLGGNWINYNTTGFTELLGTVRFNGSSLQTITCPGGENYYNVTFSKSAVTTLQYNSPVTIARQFTWTTNGPVFLNANKMTMTWSSNTAINNGTNPARYIISENVNNTSSIQWNIGTTVGAQSYVFPFGTLTGTYIPFTYAVPAGAVVGNLTLATYGTPPSNLPWPVSPIVVNNLNSTTGLLPDNRDATVDRFWEIDVTGTSPIATATFTYTSTELPVAPFNSPLLMEAQWYNSSIDKWQPAISGQISAAYTATVPGLSTYGPWTLAALTSPLPIKLLYFSAEAKNDFVDLTWETASEINNDFFTLEKSVNGKEFFSFETMKGAGNSNLRNSYSAKDIHPFKGISYYRLKQTDYDGQFTFSDIVAVNYKKEKIQYQIFPNPADQNAWLYGDTEGSEVIIRNSEGKEIKNFTLQGTSQINEINITDLAQGLYIVEVKLESDSQFLRLIKR